MLLLTGVAPAPWKAAAAPVAGADPVVSEHFGTSVTDPYRHLENLDDPHVQTWLRQQADDSKATLAEIPGRGRLLARIRDLERAAAFTVTQPQRLADGDIFFLKQAADEDVARLWVREADTGADRMLIDPDTLPRANADQHVAIDCFAASPDGRHVLYTCAADVAWKKVCDRCDAVRSFAVAGDAILLVTTGGPAHAVVRVDLAAPAFAEAETIFAPTDMVVEKVATARDAIYIEAIDHAIRRVMRLPHAPAPSGRAGAAVVATPPDEPSATIAAARADVPGVLLKTQSWIRDGGLNVFDPQTGRLTDARLAPEGREPPEWLTFTETIVESHDGTRVPLSIIHRADLVRDGSRPALLEGYGAYGVTFPMSFTPHRLAWLERGGVIAVAHVRGGSTFGRAWHHAGRRTTKPNTWKDFIACAEHLIAEGYTSSRRLCGHGRSAGGILIGRAVTERPDLFAAAHIGVGCTDMIRFETTKNGPPNIPEFGAVTEEEGFRGLLAMSTLHQIRDGAAYPAVLLTHGINDPRVAPWQSAKTAARFQEATSSGRPVLLRIDYHAGHGLGSTRRQRQEELADVWSFFLWQCGDPDFQPGSGGHE